MLSADHGVPPAWEVRQGLWRSPVAHLVRIEGVRGSNPLNSTANPRPAGLGFFDAPMIKCAILGAECAIATSAARDRALNREMGAWWATHRSARSRPRREPRHRTGQAAVMSSGWTQVRPRHSGWHEVEPKRGLEPLPLALQARRRPTTIATAWYPREESNLPPPDSDSGALSDELRGHGVSGGIRTHSAMQLLYRQPRLSHAGALTCWGDWRDLNPRSPGPQPGALTAELQPPVPAGGFEPPTCCL